MAEVENNVNKVEAKVEKDIPEVAAKSARESLANEAMDLSKNNDNASTRNSVDARKGADGQGNAEGLKQEGSMPKGAKGLPDLQISDKQTGESIGDKAHSSYPSSGGGKAGDSHESAKGTSGSGRAIKDLEPRGPEGQGGGGGKFEKGSEGKFPGGGGGRAGEFREGELQMGKPSEGSFGHGRKVEMGIPVDSMPGKAKPADEIRQSYPVRKGTK